MTADPNISPWSAVAASALSTGLAGWMAVKAYGPDGLPGCGAKSGCAEVTTGRWSRLGQLPVATLGTVLYSALLGGSVLQVAHVGVAASAVGAATTVTALVAVGGACWFMSLQVLVIRQLCGYCTVTHLLASASAVLLLARLTPWTTVTWPTELIVAGAATAAVALGQMAIVPQTFAITPVAAAPKRLDAQPMIPATGAVMLPPAAKTGLASRAGASRQRKLLGGSVVLNVDGWPRVGRPDAKHVLAALFDFTCRECHHLHRLLSAAVDQRPDWLAVAMVPVPMHPACNPTVSCDRNARAQACEYARLAWAVWLAGDADRYAEWDGYVFGDVRAVQPYGLALIRAGELVDLSRFRPRDPDPVLDRAVAAGVGLHGAAGKPIVPALILPAGILRGHVPDLKELLRQLDRQLP